MVFFSRFGYLVAVFFFVAIFIAGGVGTALQMSSGDNLIPAAPTISTTRRGRSSASVASENSGNFSR